MLNHESLIGTITQSNLHLILSSKVSGLACLLIEHKGMSIVEAIQTVYASQLYQRLKMENTKTWHLGPAALYQELEEELSSQ